jgi:RND family efflux transporter MFP subunit
MRNTDTVISKKARLGVSRSILVAAALLAAATGCDKKPPPAPGPTVVISKPLQRKIIDWDDYVGRFIAVNSVDIRPRVTGYVQSVEFKDGQMVKKGQVLFVIDPRPYEAALDQARGQESRARSTLSNAKIELARAEKLLADKAVSEQEYQARLAAEQQAQGDYLAAQGTVKNAALNLEFTKVVAPMTGRISDHRFSPGNLVTQDTSILTNITDLDPIWFIFTGAESQYIKYERAAQRGERQESRARANPVEIRLQDQPNYAIKGQMDFVDNALDPSSGTIRGRAIVPNPDHFLTPGMFGHLRLLGSGTYQALLIPDDAITTQQSDQVVYVVGEGNKLEQHKISTGPLVDGLRVVRSGLGPDDQVVIQGVTSARAGRVVSPKPGEITPTNPGAAPTAPDLPPPPASGSFSDGP